MMNETLQANARMEGEREPRQITVILCAILFGWTVGVLMGTGLGMALRDYFGR